MSRFDIESDFWSSKQADGAIDDPSWKRPINVNQNG